MKTDTGRLVEAIKAEIESVNRAYNIETGSMECYVLSKISSSLERIIAEYEKPPLPLEPVKPARREWTI